MGSSQSVYKIPGVSTDLGNCVVEQVLPSDRARTEKLIDVITTSFAGTEKTAPEGGIDWFITGDKRKNKHFEPLDSPPSKQRLTVVRLLVNLALQKYARYGACFLLVSKETGDVVGGTICVPPIKNVHKDTLWGLVKIVFSILFWFKRPSLFWKGWSRADPSQNVMNRLHSKTPDPLHWYVCMFATHPKAQGKGYGKKFLLFLAALADAAKVQSYLEATGTRNVSFYKGVGQYEDRMSLPVKTKTEVFDDAGGIHGMVRPYVEDQRSISSA